MTLFPAGRAPALARDRVRELARDLTHDLRHARDLALDRTRDNLDDLVCALDRAWTQARNLANVLGRPMPVATAEDGHRSVVRPVRAAQGLAHAAVRVLPARHRGRYREEYHSELYELAAVKASRWTQLLYAVRLLDRSWVLRAELRAPTAEQVRS